MTGPGPLDLEIRPVRVSDQERVKALCADIWEGHDYIPEVFDRWVANPNAWFQAAELDGVLVGLQRIRPLGPGLAWYEGLRVASTHRRQGVGRAMLAAALDQVRALRFTEVRLATGNRSALSLFQSLGFAVRLSPRFWEAPRMEGGDPAPFPDQQEARRLGEDLGRDPVASLYGGVTADFQGARDLGGPEMERLAALGRLRVLAGGRALAAVRARQDRDQLRVTFLSGRGGAVQDLLLALRFEADADDVGGVVVATPEGHPAEPDLEAVGYALRPDTDSWICSIKL